MHAYITPVTCIHIDKIKNIILVDSDEEFAIYSAAHAFSKNNESVLSQMLSRVLGSPPLLKFFRPNKLGEFENTTCLVRMYCKSTIQYMKLVF